MLNWQTFPWVCCSSAQQELAHRLAILREHATQLGLKHGRYTEAARINEEKGAEMESLLLKMEQRTKVLLHRDREIVYPAVSARNLYLAHKFVIFRSGKQKKRNQSPQEDIAVHDAQLLAQYVYPNWGHERACFKRRMLSSAVDAYNMLLQGR